MSQSELRIGELASRSGVSVDTVRYYERHRLLPGAARTAGGFRLFKPDAVERIRFIKQAQALGFSLNEIGEILKTGGAAECRRVRDLLWEHLIELDARIKAMREFRRTLAGHFAECEQELESHGRAAQCPVVIKSRTPG